MSVIKTLVVLAVAIILGVLALSNQAYINFAADEPHTAPIGWILETTRMQSIARRDDGNPGSVWLAHLEILVQQIRRDRQLVLRSGRGFELALLSTTQAQFPPHAFDAVHVHFDIITGKLTQAYRTPGNAVENGGIVTWPSSDYAAGRPFSVDASIRLAGGLNMNKAEQLLQVLHGRSTKRCTTIFRFRICKSGQVV